LGSDGSLFQSSVSGTLIYCRKDTHTILFSTGLFDINKREIYEGHVLKVNEHMTAVVVYYRDGFKLKTICNQSEILDRFYSWELCKILGHSLESPELLEVK
jgi:hypothetical protein